MWIPRRIRRQVLRERLEAVEAQIALYSTIAERSEIERYQLARVNAVWKRCVDEIPFYRRWATQHSLPRAIRSLKELVDFPSLTKNDIVENSTLIFRSGEIRDAYVTGGSTGTPVRYPKGRNDAVGVYAGLFAARSWWGIEPFDRYVHFWGHAHLFGEGRRQRAVARLRRRLADAFVNGVRLDAYDLTAERLQSHRSALTRVRPSFVVGYTSTVYRLARAIEEAGFSPDEFASVRNVILTSETVTPADVEVIGRVFGANVVNEYGAAETGNVAVSRGTTDRLQVLWASHIVLADEAGNLRITTLENREFPLINYAIGDQGHGDAIGNVLELSAIKGRLHDVLSVAAQGGGIIHFGARLPIHILKTLKGVLGVQFRQIDQSRLEVLVHAVPSVDMSSVSRKLESALTDEFPSLDWAAVSVRRVGEPVLTAAGKLRVIVP